jgi:hypothetical protein
MKAWATCLSAIHGRETVLGTAAVPGWLTR